MTNDYRALVADERVQGSVYADPGVYDDEMDRIFTRAASGDGGRAWIDLSRGLDREDLGDDGRRRARVSDQTTNRGFWRHYREAMAAG